MIQANLLVLASHITAQFSRLEPVSLPDYRNDTESSSSPGIIDTP